MDLFSVKEAANSLSLSEQHIRLLLTKGEIKGKKLGHDWVVLSLDYKRKRRPKSIRDGVVDQIDR